MTPTETQDPASASEETEVIYHHSKGVTITLVFLLSGLLGLFVFAALYGPGFEPNSSDLDWAILLGSLLLCLLLTFLWILWKRPIAMIVSGAGLDLPFAFKRPLRWDEIQRVRLVPQGKSFYGNRQWLIVDPSPGVLAPIRLKSWRRLDLWFQKHHGVRIPIHGLDADADRIVQSIERFRPVIRHDG